MDIIEAIKGRRTIRKFSKEKLSTSLIEEIIDSARYAPSASNVQPLKYIIVNDEQKVSDICNNIKWARYIKEGYGNEESKPVAFIIVLVDTDIRESGYEIDIGASVQNILLSAYSKGVGSCWMGAINRTAIRKILGIPYKYLLSTVVALGTPDEQPILQPLDSNGSVEYYKDDNGVLNVPKRKLEDIIIKL